MTNFEQFQKSVGVPSDHHRGDMAIFKLPTSIFTWLKKACTEARGHKNKVNSQLAGHIKEEYDFKNISENFLKFLLQCTGDKSLNNYLTHVTYLSENRPLYLHSMWVNYMKKHEFNPPHNHSGVLSFVIFVKIPYDLKEEEKCFTPQKPHNFTSKFVFHNINPDGSLRTEGLNVDKSFEGVMLMFPSAQVHEVFPFYTSESYRITVSGNVRIKI
tara:strand:+ start:873 stop:1514 length:642 start_codon:yes stop_codon:yes gene_type:complete